MSEKTNLDWKKYESITKYIYETLGKQNGVEIVCYGNSCKVTGKSSVDHQVDVLTKFSDGIHEYKTAIECKYWNKTINKDIVMKVSDIVEDAGINKGVIVSKLGFTPDGIKFAKYKNIGLVELREITEEDWKGRVKNIVININVMLPEINGVELMIDPNTQTKVNEGMNEVAALQIHKPKEEIIEFSTLIKDFQDELCKQEENKQFQKELKFPTGTTIKNIKSDAENLIEGLKLNGILRISKEKVELNGEDYVWLIMKSIFEDKTYTISKDQKIREHRK